MTRRQNMEEETVGTASAQQYAAAYETHYTTRDLREALRLYKSIMVESPDSAEAGYSRSQIQNIAKAVVPEKELSDAQWDLALSHVTGRK
jgi:hypothetical protein